MIAILMIAGYLACLILFCLVVVPRLFRFTDEEHGADE